jgi:hypothetical protein
LFGKDAGPDPVTWTGYRKAMFDHLKKTQKEDGSWLGDFGSSSAGPVYSTALYAIVMQQDREVIPFLQRRR